LTSDVEGGGCTSGIGRQYSGLSGDKFGFGAFGWGRKTPVSDGSTAGSATARRGECGAIDVGIAANVWEGLDVCGNLVVYGGGGVGFITTSGVGPPRLFFSGPVLEELAAGEVGD